MPKLLDLEKHISITGTQAIHRIICPLEQAFGIKFFRYLKLYKSGKRILLTNIPDATRYMYGQGHYLDLWYDGEFPEYLKEGWYTWHINRLLDMRPIEEKIENDLISLLQVHHGTTFVQEGDGYYEIFSFDTQENHIYKIDRNLLLRFISYFREQARKLIILGEHEAIILPIQNSVKCSEDEQILIKFLQEIKVKRYYLGGKYGDAYLTAKEIICVRWMIEGKTAEEIAIIENIHPKTVQRHIENIKLKFSCQKQTQVIQIFLKSGIISDFSGRV